MSDLYVASGVAASPLSLSDAKAYLKVTSSSEDTLIQALIDSATVWGEQYTGVDFRAKTWTLSTDEFAERITLWKSFVSTITSVKYNVSDVLTTVSSANYYLKKHLTYGEILLKDAGEWPADLDDIEHGVQIIFTTVAYPQPELILSGLKAHVAFARQNRGDCCTCDGSNAFVSGAKSYYDLFKIPRF